MSWDKLEEKELSTTILVSNASKMLKKRRKITNEYLIALISHTGTLEMTSLESVQNLSQLEQKRLTLCRKI
jgi:hypothetical protein